MLCGGASRRMGRDKALIERDGTPLARRVADALAGGGCDRIVAIGGDEEALAALDLAPVVDRWPGAGPLAGLATALRAVPEGSTLVVAPCDLLDPSAEPVHRLLSALDRAAPELDASVARVGGRVEWIHSAWRVRPRLVNAVTALVEGGARRLDAVAAVVQEVPVEVAPGLLRDADTPGDLAGRGEREGQGRGPSR